MAGLNSIMDNSLSALFAAQAGLATVGHNIANANTPGYSRQEVLLTPRRPTMMPFGALGRGVEIVGIRRIQDEFLLSNLRVQQSRMEDFNQTDSALAEVESILGSVDNDHLGNALNNFFNSWSALAQPPINSSLKQNVVASATSLVNDFHAINNALDDLEGQIEVGIQAEIKNLNSLLGQVAALNQQIMSAEGNGQQANDLRDQRDLIIMKVSGIAEVSVIERDDGTKDLILAGRTMVARDQVNEFTSSYQETGAGYQMTIVTNGTMQKVDLSPGKLRGLLNSRDVQIKDVRNKLDGVAQKIIADVNALHTQGRTANSSGLAFFTGTSIHTIAVNPALVADRSLVATGRTSAPGDNTLALDIANLATVGSSGSGNQTVNDVYRSLLIDVASSRNSFQFLVENQQNVVASLKTKLSSVSGVSLDEEGANMVRYQNSYSAAAKVITTVQAMYDSLFSML